MPMTQPIMRMVASVLLLGVLVACGQRQPAASHNVGSPATTTFLIASPNSPATPSMQTAPVGSPAVAGETPASPGLVDPILAQRALDHVRETKIVRSGAPKVVLALLAPARVLNQFLDLEFINYSPACDYQEGLVILKGDFDIAGYMPGFGDAGPALVKYIALTYDPRFGFMGIIGDPNGSSFKHALNDPSLPDPATPIASPVGTPEATPAGTPIEHYLTCPVASPAATPYSPAP